MAQVSYGTITITDTTNIESVKNWYLATNASSGVTKTTSGWTDTIQQMTTTKQYLWNYEQILGANNTEISSTQPVIIGHYGINGQNGVDGNSITSIDEYYQVTNSTTNPGSSGWQKNTLVTPTSTNKYLWNYQVINYSKTAAEGSYTDARIIGVYGDTGPQGPQGNPGTNGINTATVYLYQRAASAPSKPSGTLTYTFSSAQITSGTLGNWKQSIGELTGTDPIWVIAAVASSNGTTDTIASSEWSDQIKLAQDGTNGTNGTNGLNQATVYIYKRATSATAPSATTYTFSNGSFTVPSGWSKTIPASNGNPCYVTSAVAIGNGTTATLTWNTPSVLVEDGTDGISPTVTTTSTGVKIVDAAGNTTYINNGSNGTSYYTHIRYATDASGSGMSSSPTGKTYIGVYSGTSATAPTTANSYTWSKYVGDNGQPGGTGPQGVSVTQVRELYYLTTGNAPSKPTSSSTIYNYDIVGAWTSVVPEYIVNGNYYISLETTLSNNTKVFSDVVLDQALTDACYNAAIANSISQSANENAQGAMSQAAEAQYQTEALGAKLKYFFYPGDSNYPGVYAASGISGTTFNEGSISTYGYNVAIKPASISVGYNNIQAILIDGSNPSLKFYTPSKTTQATNPSMELSSTALTFNNPTTGQAQLTLSASGSLQSGNYERGSDVKFATSGTKIDLTAGDIITQYFRLSQGGESGGPTVGAYIHGTIEALSGRIGGYTDSGSTTNNYWDIGNFTDYNLQRSAKMIGHGSSFVQLGDNLTWRLATNRIHTGWYISSDSYLHFPEYTDGSETRRWDYGIHVPTSKNDKFLYIRNANSTTSLANLIYDLEDSHTTHYWTYKFYIDGEGNVHAPGFFIGDSTTPIGGGTGTVAERLLNGGGTSNRPVYFPTSGDNLGKPIQITVTDNSSATAVSSTDTNLITARTLYYAGYVKSSGITSVTVAATSPVVSSTATAQTGSSASTTISLANAYGDTKNPYGSKTKNYVLAAPSDAAGTPSFRALVAADIPDLSGTYLTSHQTVTNKGATLSWGSAVTVATIGSTDIKVSLPSNPNTNTTYTFANGTNGFTVTPSGGSAQTVTVTPSITNNVTGSGTSGSLVKWNGANTITNGPALGTDTTKFLNNKGEWAVPAGTYTYTLPLAANGTRGGVQIGYTQSGKNYPVQLSSEKMYVNVPWENTTYSAGTGLSLSGNTFSNSGVLSITTTAGAHTVISSSTGAVSFNVPTKTSHLSNDSGFLTNSTLYEANLNWGGRDFSAGYSPIDAAMIDVLGANRFAFLKAAGLTIEYSTDSGSNYTDYGATDAQKVGLFSSGQSFYLGKHTSSGSCTTNDRLRVTIATSAANIYTVLNKIAIYMSTSGATVQVLIEKALESTPTTFTTHKDWTGISGWSGWNILNISGLTTYGNTAASQYGRIRFTFRQTAVNTNYSSANISKIMGFGGVGWTTPSNMAATGHLYLYDSSQNATFPAKVTATSFSGNLTGNVTGNVSGSAGSVAWSGVGSKPTTLSGYGITDAKIASGVITLGSNTITPLTSATLVTGASNSKVNTAQSTNGNVYLNLVVNDNIQNAHNIVGSGTVSVTSDANGKITIAGTAHPSELPNPKTLSIVVYSSTSTTVTSSTTTYKGNEGSNSSVDVAGKNAVTNISSNTAGQLILTRADCTQSNPITVKITATTSDTAASADKLSISTDAGSTSIPVYFPASTGLPTAVTSIAYSLLPTGTTANTVATGNHTHTISLAADTGTTGVVSLSHGGKYKLTAGGNSVIFTLPADNNTDTLVTQAYSTTNSSYPLLLTATSGITSTNSRGATTAILNNQIYANPNTGTITATTFSGNATTATTASKLGNSTLGSSTKPIYLSSGTATECSTYAGGTKVTLNGDDKGASTASFYAPTSAGTANYVLISNGSGAPTWTAQSNITSGNSDENVKSTAVTAATTNYIVGSTTSTTTTGGLSKHASAIIYTTADSGTSGYTQLRLGNTTATSSAGGKEGQIRLYGTTATYYVDLKAGAPSANRTITLPNATGTVALVGSTTSSVATGITISDHGTTSVGSASGWNAGSASSWTFEDISCDDITSWDAGSGSASISGAIDSNDTSQLNITISHTHTAPLLAYTARIVSSKSGGSNGTAPSLTITSTPVVNGKSHTVTDPKHSHTNG